MNNKTQLSEQAIEQEVNRVVKASQIYEAGLVDKISTNEYIVGGRYYVEYYGGGMYTCNCADHSFRQVRCKHIIAIQFYEMGV